MASADQKMLAISGIVVMVISCFFYLKYDNPLKGDMTGFVIFGSIGLIMLLFAMVWPRPK